MDKKIPVIKYISGLLILILAYLSFEFLINMNLISEPIGRFVWISFIILSLLFLIFSFYKMAFLAFITLFTLIFIFTRLPFYLVFLYGEDGVFANIYLNSPEKPLIWLIGQVNRVKYYSLIHHPTFSFAYMSTIGHLAKVFLDFDKMNDIELAFFIRLVHSFSFWLSWILIFWVLFKKIPNYFNTELNKMFMIVIVNLPIAIHLSTSEIHMDQSFGVFSATLLICSLALFNGKLYHKLILVLVATIFNLGKNEWSFCLLCSLLLIFVSQFYFQKNQRKYISELSLILLIGFVLGNCISVMYDFENYLSGLDLMIDSAYKTTFAKFLPRIDILPQQFIHLSPREFNEKDFLKASSERLEYIVPLLVFLILGGWYLFKSKSLRENPIFLFLFFFGSFLFFAFAATTHSHSVRYFALAFMTLGYCFLWTIDFIKGKWIRIIQILTLTIFVFAILREFSLQINLRNKHEIAYFKGENPDLISLKLQKDCIGFYPPVIFNRPFNYLIDWGRGSGYELASKKHLKTCD